jgi:hypothetical protein
MRELRWLNRTLLKKDSIIISEVWMESVATVIEASDLLIKMFLVFEVNGSISENLALVFWVCKTHIVVEVSD